MESTVESQGSQTLVEEAGSYYNLPVEGSNLNKSSSCIMDESVTRQRFRSIKSSHQETIFQDFLFFASKSFLTTFKGQRTGKHNILEILK